jgi:hypothetical protein
MVHKNVPVTFNDIGHWVEVEPHLIFRRKALPVVENPGQKERQTKKVLQKNIQIWEKWGDSCKEESQSAYQQQLSQKQQREGKVGCVQSETVQKAKNDEDGKDNEKLERVCKNGNGWENGFGKIDLVDKVAVVYDGSRRMTNSGIKPFPSRESYQMERYIIWNSPP